MYVLENRTKILSKEVIFCNVEDFSGQELHTQMGLDQMFIIVFIYQIMSQPENKVKYTAQLVEI